MSDAQGFGALLKDLKKVNDSNVKQLFTPLFQRGYALFDYSNDDAARVFDSSTRNVRRWKSGQRVPPAATLVLKFLREEVEKQMRKGSNGVRKAAPSRQSQSSPKPVKKAVTLGRANSNYPTTCTTFWKQMEPALHAVMEEALKKTKITGSQKTDYKGVTRRIYRAAVISATTFLQKKTQPSQHFLKKQGDEAVNKAVTKLYDGKDELDSESSYNENEY